MRVLLVLVSLCVPALALGQSMPSVAFSWYAGETAASMVSKYRLRVLVATNTGEASIPLNLDCSRTAGSCLQLLPMYPSGTVLSITVQAACAATPTLFGPRSPAVTWTVGSPLPSAPVLLPPVPDPCAPAPPPNQPPTVSLAAPPSVVVGTSVVLTASAADPDDSVQAVEFWVGTTKLPDDATPPYTAAWLPTAAGTYQLRAVARDTRGASTTSAVVTVTVTAPPPPAENQPPTVSMSSPVNGSTVLVGSPITVSATAADPDGTIASVRLRLDGDTLFLDPSAPYATTWTPPTAGTYWFEALATDNGGLVTTSARVTITAVVPAPNQPPVVSMTAPVNGSTVVAPLALTLKADASDPDGSLVKREFLLVGGTVIVVEAGAPYEANHAIPGPGIYGYRARVTDDRGAVVTSPEVVVTAVAPPPPPPPMPAAPVLREAGISQCRFVLRADKPDSTSGWSAQFRRNGVNVSNKDSSPPYERTIRVAPGLYTWDVVWTKSGVPSQTSAAIKTGLTCQAVP